MIEIHRCLRQICDRTGHGGHRETVNPDSVVGWNLLAVKLDIRLGSLTSGWRREFMTRRYEIPQMVYPCCRDMGNGHRIIRVESAFGCQVWFRRQPRGLQVLERPVPGGRKGVDAMTNSLKRPPGAHAR